MLPVHLNKYKIAVQTPDTGSWSFDVTVALRALLSSYQFHSLIAQACRYSSPTQIESWADGREPRGNGGQTYVSGTVPGRIISN